MATPNTIETDDLSPGDDPLELARRYDHTLLATRSFALGETRVPASSVLWRRPDRTTDERVFLFPRETFGVRLAGEPAAVIHPGCAVVPWTDVPFQRLAVQPEGERSDWVWTAPELSEELRLPRSPGSRWILPVEGRSLLRVRRLCALAAGGAAASSTATIESALAETLGAVVRAVDGRPAAPLEGATRSQRSRVLAAIGYVTRRSDEHFELADVAAAADLSVGALCRTFRRVTGLTVHGYLRTYRLCRSIDRLRERHADLASLALDLGFSSHAHFSARFRAWFGCTPSAARRLLSTSADAASRHSAR